MADLEHIAEQAHASFEARTQARDQALVTARQITRHSAYAIRAIHREEWDLADDHIAQARQMVDDLVHNLKPHPDLYYAGYTQDAIKEFAEASLVRAMVANHPLPDPADLRLEMNTYLNGLAETVGELRRRCLDILRMGYSQEAGRLLSSMDEIYAILVTMDYPDAITNGLRRQTDLVRGILERTRADLTISLREDELKQKLDELSSRLDGTNQ